jgi:hypothetical protein
MLYLFNINGKIYVKITIWYNYLYYLGIKFSILFFSHIKSPPLDPYRAEGLTNHQTPLLKNFYFMHCTITRLEPEPAQKELGLAL